MIAEIKAESNPNIRRRRRNPRIRHRILWVDDDVNVVSAFSRRLRRKGIEVIPASDGMQGFWLTVTRKPDLVVTDLRMPRWEGGELLDCLVGNSETSRAPVVVVSGHVTPEVRSRMLRMGVVAVLEKPVDWTTLLRTLRENLPRKRQVTV